VTSFLPRGLRERGERVGFSLKTIASRRGMLARVGSEVDGGPDLD
jgi:nucleoside-triphosphatase THEP1